MCVCWFVGSFVCLMLVVLFEIVAQVVVEFWLVRKLQQEQQ